MEEEQSKIVGGGCKLLRSGGNKQEWNGMGTVPTIQRTEGTPDQCEQEYNDPVMSRPYRARTRRYGG